jgi:hypothetical protein
MTIKIKVTDGEGLLIERNDPQTVDEANAMIAHNTPRWLNQYHDDLQVSVFNHDGTRVVHRDLRPNPTTVIDPNKTFAVSDGEWPSRGLIFVRLTIDESGTVQVWQ